MIFRNRIEIYSPGTFPERITPEEFAEGDKKAIRRNRLITQTLYYSKDMETFAFGLKKIKDLCSESGVRYEFKREEYGFTVVFYRHCGEGWGWSSDSMSDKSDTDVAQNVAQNVPQQNDLEKIIINAILSDDKVTRAETAASEGISVKTVERKLKEIDNVIYVGRGKNGHWVIIDKGEL